MAISIRALTALRQALRDRNDGELVYNVLKNLTASAGTDVTFTNGIVVGGTTTLNGSTTLATGKTLTVTDADALTVGGKIVPQTITASFYLPGALPATAANHGVMFFTAPFACKVLAVTERHSTAGSDGSAVTTMLTKVPSGTAVAAGTACLSAGINLKATADTNQSGALNATAANYTLAAGDSLAMALTGTPTSLAGMSVTVNLQRV
jgi:hypothetical protein